MTFCKWTGECDVFAYEALSGHYTVLTHMDAGELGGKSYHEKTLADLKERLKLLKEAGLKVPQAALAAVSKAERSEVSDMEDYK